MPSPDSDPSAGPLRGARLTVAGAAIAAVVAGGVGLSFCACESSPTEAIDAAGAAAVEPAAPARDWVRRGSGEWEGRLYGVGRVAGIRNPALALATADNRARAAVAALLGTADGERALGGVQIIDHWRTPDGVLYALAVAEKPE